VNPKINAVATALYDQGRAAARQPLFGPFAGVPFAMKDLNQGMAGVRLTNGSVAFKDNICRADSESVRRYRAAGLVFIATSTTPEFGLTFTTESRLFGQTRNPWALDRIAGGSSGGAAALTAAGVAPMAHATDGGGSIRIPASACGLFGLKVSRGRTPVGMGRTEGWSGLGVSHAVTRSVRDSAALLDASHGPEAGSRYVAPPPQGTFLSALNRPPRKLKIALQTKAWSNAPVHPECEAAVKDAARLCTDLGHEVEAARPDIDFDALQRALIVTLSAHTAATVAAREAELGRSLSEDELELVTRLMSKTGAKALALDLIAADAARMAAANVMGAFFQTYDLILSPTLGLPPVELGVVSLDVDPRTNADLFAQVSPFASVYNQTGQPAMSVPLHWSAEGLPIGVMFAARLGEEAQLLSLAAQLEQARPWFQRRPSLI
jgi:amidase